MRPIIRWARLLVTTLLSAAALAVIAGGILHRPVLLGLVPSQSMVPALQPSDLAIIWPKWASRPVSTGSVIVFQDEDRPWVVHRIVGGDAETGFITQGDANPEPDPRRVQPTAIVGVVPQWGRTLLHLPGFGRLTQSLGWVRQPAVLGILGCLGVLLLFLDLRKRRGRKRRAVRFSPLSLWGTLVGITWLTVATLGVLGSTHIQGTYRVVTASRTGLLPGEVLAGVGRTEVQRLENPYPIPIAVLIVPRVDGIVVSPETAILAPKAVVESQIIVVGDRPPGYYPIHVQVGFYPPLLPLAWLKAAAELGDFAVAALVASVTAAIVALVGWFDSSVREAMRAVWLRRWAGL